MLCAQCVIVCQGLVRLAAKPNVHTCVTYVFLCFRDTDGNLFLKDAPYVTDPYSLERVALGLPFPVKCCWNGLVVMNAKPFSQLGLRVR